MHNSKSEEECQLQAQQNCAMPAPTQYSLHVWLVGGGHVRVHNEEGVHTTRLHLAKCNTTMAAGIIMV